MPKFNRHIFICINDREPGHPRGCCAAKDAQAIVEAFKQALASRGLKDSVRANKAQCLDQCEHGPTVVVYPEQTWYGFVKPQDVDEIIESHIVNGNPVQRLLLPETCINTASCPHRAGGMMTLGLG